MAWFRSTELLLTLMASREPPADSPLSLVLKANDATAVGSTELFLKSRLRYEKDANGQELCLLRINETEEVGVMMGWEREISEHLDIPTWYEHN